MRVVVVATGAAGAVREVVAYARVRSLVSRVGRGMFMNVHTYGLIKNIPVVIRYRLAWTGGRSW